MLAIDRISQFIERKGLSVLAFEKSIGTRSTIANAIKKRTDISSKWISKIIEIYPELNSEWLLTGKGTMFNGNSNQDVLGEQSIIYGEGDRIILDVGRLMGTKDLHKLAFFLNKYFDELSKDEVFAVFADRLKDDHQREVYEELTEKIKKETALNESEIRRVLTSKPKKVN